MKKLFPTISAALFAASFAFGQSANMKTVMANYEAFGKGDIPALIATCSPDVVWSHAGDPAILPIAGVYVGLAGLGEFFQKVGAAGPVLEFTPSDFGENGRNVWNKCRIRAVSTATGKEHSSLMTFVWTFDEMGKVVAWAATGDTKPAEAAFTK